MSDLSTTMVRPALGLMMMRDAASRMPVRCQFCRWGQLGEIRCRHLLFLTQGVLCAAHSAEEGAAAQAERQARQDVRAPLHCVLHLCRLPEHKEYQLQTTSSGPNMCLQRALQPIRPVCNPADAVALPVAWCYLLC